MDELGELLLANAGAGNTEAVKDLVARGARVNYPEEELGDRPLHRAAMEGHTATAAALIELGADVNAADNLGQRPLHWAADGGHMETIGLLIANGAQVAAIDSDGKTAADWASERHSEAETFLRKLEARKGTSRQRAR